MEKPDRPPAAAALGLSLGLPVSELIGRQQEAEAVCLSMRKHAGSA